MQMSDTLPFRAIGAFRCSGRRWQFLVLFPMAQTKGASIAATNKHLQENCPTQIRGRKAIQPNQ